MTPDNNQHVIVYSGYGNYTAYACTLANARALLEEHLGNLCRDIRDIASALASDDKPLFLVQDHVVKAMQELVELPDGSPTRYLRHLLHGAAPAARSGKADERPEAPTTEALRHEVALWAFNNKLNPHSLRDAGYKLPELKPHESLSFLARFRETDGREVRYVSGADYDAALELRRLQHGTWKEGVAEHRIVQNYLEFIKDHLIDASEFKLEIGAYKAQA